LESFLEAWRERAAPHKLFFQSRRQLISLGKSGRKAALVLVIPSANSVTILMVFTLVIFVSVRTVSLSVSLSVPLSLTLG
jgi:hypothetical protein